ncbi:MAG: membrane integrity-associated transporter subunit PqiC, partial [Rhodospirillales bacterium]|nr:membrane integrity-associated transporter subunit PqiC [Rhodospirillales bacterium]
MTERDKPMPITMPPNTRNRRFPRPFSLFPVPALLLVIFVAACVQPAVPTDRYFRMVVTAPETPLAKQPFGDIIVVERPSAEGLLISRPILYVDARQSNELREYPYDYWAESPAIMIRNELVRCLEGVGAAPRVLSDDLRVNGNHSVVGSLQRLEHVV